MKIEEKLRRAAGEGTLDKVPKKEITAKRLLEENTHGCNAFHYAAMRGCLNQIPKEFLTEENLSRSTSDGWDCFRLAADCNRLGKIPKKLLTPKTLLLDAETYVNSPAALCLRHRGEFSKLPLNKREWAPYIEKVEALCLAMYSMKAKEELKVFIQELEALKRIKEMPSLKV